MHHIMTERYCLMTTARGTAKIFLIGKDEENLTPMEETAYETEDVLQTALARYPDLLAGDQIDPEDPRRWLLVAREVGIPGDVDETGRWSLDHLFLDQDGVPTLSILASCLSLTLKTRLCLEQMDRIVSEY